MIKKILVAIISLLVIIAMLLGLITLVEYRPQDRETLSTIGTATSALVETQKEYSIASFNIGYGGLGETEDSSWMGAKRFDPKAKLKLKTTYGTYKQNYRN